LALRTVTGLFLLANTATLFVYLFDQGAIYRGQELFLGSVLGALCITAVMLLLGVATPIVAPLSMGLLALAADAMSYATAGDYVFGALLFWLSAAALAPNSDISGQRPRSRQSVPRWICMGFLLQITLILGVNGWVKTGDTWSQGSAVHFLLTNPRWGRFEYCDISWLARGTAGELLTWTFVGFERLFVLAAAARLVELLSDHNSRLLRSICWFFAAAAMTLGAGVSILANLGWFVPLTFAAAGLLLLRGPAVHSPVSLRRQKLRRTRIILLLVAVPLHVASMLMASWATLVQRSDAPLLAWRRISNTHQLWRMFSPDVPRAHHLLEVKIVDIEGRSTTEIDERLSIGGGAGFGYSRSTKLHENILRSAQVRKEYALNLCRRGGTRDSTIFFVKHATNDDKCTESQAPKMDPGEEIGSLSCRDYVKRAHLEGESTHGTREQ
jgi:hypothetical protein